MFMGALSTGRSHACVLYPAPQKFDLQRVQVGSCADGAAPGGGNGGSALSETGAKYERASHPHFAPVSAFALWLTFNSSSENTSRVATAQGLHAVSQRST